MSSTILPTTPPNERNYQAMVIALLVAPLLVTGISAGAYYHYSKQVRAPLAVRQIAPIAVVSSKPELAAANSQYIGSSRYPGITSPHSLLDKESTGKLYKVTNSQAGITYLTATPSTADLAAYHFSADWSVSQIGSDSMWVPGACAQKPSWILANRYLVIDDGNLAASDPAHYYAAYDTVSQTFTDFGSNQLTGNQSNEKILFVDKEDDRLVFYIDQRDTSGPFTQSASFKHSRDSHENFIIRRVINVADLSYDDYKLPYDAPAATLYHTQAYSVTMPDGTSHMEIEITGDGNQPHQYGAFIAGKGATLSATTPWSEESQHVNVTNESDKLAGQYADAAYQSLTSTYPGLTALVSNPDGYGGHLTKDDLLNFSRLSSSAVSFSISSLSLGQPVPAIYFPASKTSVGLVPTDQTDWITKWANMAPFIIGSISAS